MKKAVALLLLLAAFFSCIKKIKQNCVEVHIYFDKGVWAESVIYIENLLSQQGISYKRIDARRIKENDFSSCARLLTVPGGNPETYRISLGAEGMSNLMAFVRRGGDYFGICAGSELVAQTVIWEGIEYSGLRGFFPGKSHRTNP